MFVRTDRLLGWLGTTRTGHSPPEIEENITVRQSQQVKRDGLGRLVRGVVGSEAVRPRVIRSHYARNEILSL